jgi:hypothetical protein
MQQLETVISPARTIQRVSTSKQPAPSWSPVARIISAYRSATDNTTEWGQP